MQRILIANRGEIARRIQRTCRRMGIDTVAVFSDADADAPFVREADIAVRIGPPAAAQSYLDIDKIIDAARRTGADGIHPGYGFLAENPALATACADAGITFIGPSANVIASLGSKREAKRLVSGAGVPVVPGYNGDDQSPDTLAREAKAIGFPVLLKASAGGGGKGMRIVASEDELPAAIEAAKREAMGAFGDDTMLIEKYVERPRHVELQILGDSHGNLVHLFERECSVQRRHQKIIEETPSPAVSPELRQKMGEAAVAVGKAVGYQNAGTVEFILAPNGEFYFLEVNTRLQVEHPVTECVTGIDLVREQIRVARGERLDFQQTDLTMTGAAIEARLYAEDPDNGFLPTSGRIVDWSAPEGDGVRFDTGVTGPCDVGIHYDPMLAKVVCFAATRAEAVDLLIHTLRRTVVSGITTNRDYLVRVLRHAAFRSGEVDTHFIDTHSDALAAGATGLSVADAAVAAAIADHEQRRGSQAVLPTMEPGFRNNPAVDQRVEYDAGGTATAVSYANQGGGRLRVRVDDGEPVVFSAVSWAAPTLVLENADGTRTTWRVTRAGDRRFVHGLGGGVTLVEAPRFPDAGAEDLAGACTAPMPGAVVTVLVGEGDSVKAGDTLVILEAMKMEHQVKASEDGVVAQLLVEAGQQVDGDQLLVVVTPDGENQDE